MRRKDREITDIQTIKKILDGSSVMHIALNNGTYPYILPVNYGYKLDGDKLELFFHSSKEGGKHSIIENDCHAAFELECETEFMPTVHMQASSVRALSRLYPKAKRKNTLPHLWHISASAQQNSAPLILQTQKCTG